MTIAAVASEDAKGLATRQSSSECLNFIGKGQFGGESYPVS
jgi:hypothetical protein